jgi:hypothetical protein
MGNKVTHRGRTYIFYCYTTKEMGVIDGLGTEWKGYYVDSPTNAPTDFCARPSQNNKPLYWVRFDELDMVSP